MSTWHERAVWFSQEPLTAERLRWFVEQEAGRMPESWRPVARAAIGVGTAGAWARCEGREDAVVALMSYTAGGLREPDPIRAQRDQLRGFLAELGATLTPELHAILACVLEWLDAALAAVLAGEVTP